MFTALKTWNTFGLNSPLHVEKKNKANGLKTKSKKGKKAKKAAHAENIKKDNRVETPSEPISELINNKQEGVDGNGERATPGQSNGRPREHGNDRPSEDGTTFEAEDAVLVDIDRSADGESLAASHHHYYQEPSNVGSWPQLDERSDYGWKPINTNQ